MMDEILKCLICKKDYPSENVIIKTCNHTICDFCLFREVLHNYSLVKSKIKSDSPVNMKCLSCDTSAVNKITKQEIIRRISNEFPEATKTKCRYDEHQEELIKYCIDCKWEMCEKCDEIHSKLPFKNHKFTNSKDSLNTMQCPNDNDKLVYQCLDCNKPSCLVCWNIEHLNHKLKPIGQFCKELKEKLSNINLPITNSNKNPSSKVKDYFTNMNSNIDKLVVLLNSFKTDPDLKAEEFENLNKPNELFPLLFNKFNNCLQTVEEDDIENLISLNKLNKDYTLPEVPHEFKSKSDKEIERIISNFLPEIEKIKTKNTPHRKTSIENKSHNIDIKVEEEIINEHYQMEYDNLEMNLTKGVTSLALFGETKIVSGSEDSIIRIYDMETKEVNFIEGHAKKITSVVLLEDGLRIASSSVDSFIKIWNLSTKKVVKTITSKKNNNNDHPTCLLSLPGGKLVVGKKDKGIEVWDYDSPSKTPFKLLEGHRESVNCFILLRNGNFISGSSDGFIRIWNYRSDFECVKSLQITHQPIYSLAEIKEGEIAIGLKKDIIIKNIENEEEYETKLTGHKNSIINNLILLPDGNLLSSSKNKIVKVWDANSKKCLHTENDVVSYGPTALLLLRNGDIACCSEGDKSRLLILRTINKIQDS